MSLGKAAGAFALALVFTLTGALAQTTASPAGKPAEGVAMGPMGGGAAGMSMIGAMPMMRMMMGQHTFADHIEGRIAFLKVELKITEEQQPLWKAVADAMRAAAKGMSMMPQAMPMMSSSASLPEKLAAGEKMMTAHLEALRTFKSAIEPLYAALDAEQKKSADQLLIGPMGMMGIGMM